MIDAGAGEDKARAAASTIGDVNQLAIQADIVAIKANINLLRWMVGFNLALSAVILPTLIFK